VKSGTLALRSSALRASPFPAQCSGWIGAYVYRPKADNTMQLPVILHVAHLTCDIANAARSIGRAQILVFSWSSLSALSQCHVCQWDGKWSMKLHNRQRSLVHYRYIHTHLMYVRLSYRFSRNLKPRLHDTTGCTTRFDNRLYRVNGVLQVHVRRKTVRPKIYDADKCTLITR